MLTSRFCDIIAQEKTTKYNGLHKLAILQHILHTKVISYKLIYKIYKITLNPYTCTLMLYLQLQCDGVRTLYTHSAMV